MKIRLLLFIILVISITIPVISFAQKSSDCTFGDQTNLDHVFEKDFAVKAFTEKHQNATRSIPNESDNINNIIFQAKNNSIKEALEIKFSTDEKGCFIPASYHYFYDDGIINATARNSVANFTEIMNLIKSNDKSIEDFYPKDCNFVSLDLTITSGKSFGVCKETTSRAITILVDSDSEGTLKVDIPIKTLYSLPSKDCKPTGDFFVELDEEEAHSEITPTDIGNSVKIEFPKGFHKIRIMGMVIIPDPSPAQYCGIVEGYLDKKYLAPLDQTDNGVAFKFIRCNDGLVLIQKYDDTPACVTFETKEMLIHRGWAKGVPSYAEKILDELRKGSHEITSEQINYIQKIVLVDSRVQELINGREYVFNCCVTVSELDKLPLHTISITINIKDSDDLIVIAFDLDDVKISSISEDSWQGSSGVVAENEN